MDFKDQWNIEMAMQVLVSDSVDGMTWAEAAKWLMLYGPLELQRILLNASVHATSTSFPELKPSGFNGEGEPLYRMDHLAEALGADLETLKEKLEHCQEETDTFINQSDEDIFKIQ